MRDAMARLFDDPFFRSPFGGLLGRAEAGVPLEIVEHEDAVEIRAAVPGFKPEEIEVQLQGDLLTLRGTVEARHEEEKGNCYLREWRIESFQRAVQLPGTVDADKAEAHFVHGVLTLRLPKVPEQIARKIEVQV
jgi:HSP20 family protein